MSQRGGRQQIPRPNDATAGPPPPWAHLDPAELRFDLASIRRILMATPRVGPADVPSGGYPDWSRATTNAAREAAVLIALFERDGEARVVLTKRPETMPSHQGEIAFPGGKREPAIDASLSSTALREAFEEVSLDPDAVELVAQLESLSTVASQFVITPFVGLLDRPPVLVAHPREVAKIFDVALSELFAPQTHRSEIWPLRSGRGELTIHFYELMGETVWGATARILTNLLSRLAASRS